MSLISPRVAVQALLLAIPIYAAYGLYQVVVPWGTGKLLVKNAKASKLPKRGRYVGIGPVDKLLTNLNYFFWPVMNNHNSQLSRQSFQFAGQIAVVWMMVMYESSRPLNRHKWISYTTIFGLILQIATYAVTFPLWLTAYMAVQSHSFAHLNAKPSNLDCFSIVMSIIVGFVIPAALSTLPLSSSLTANDKLGYMAVWQVFPLWTGLIHQLLRILLPVFSSTGPFEAHSTTKANKMFYSLALILAAGSRCLGKITELYMGSTGSIFQVSSMRFSPHPPASKFKTLEEGIGSFLAWDETLGSLSAVIWAFYELGSVATLPSFYQQVQYAGILAMLYVIAGPAGVLVATRWITDNIRG